VARDQHNIAWGALTLLTAIEGARYIPNVIHVSGMLNGPSIAAFSPHERTLGTIKHAQLAAIAHNREIVARYRALSKNPGMLAGFADDL
jgi:ribonuclease P/MRP protein subunit POP5